MSDFQAKMHQICFLLGLRPRPNRGVYSSSSPDHLGLLYGQGGEGKAKGEEKEGMDVAHTKIFAWHPYAKELLLPVYKML